MHILKYIHINCVPATALIFDSWTDVEVFGTENFSTWACYISLSIRFDHGPRDSVTTKTEDRRPRFLSTYFLGSCFHTAWGTMIKSYNISNMDIFHYFNGCHLAILSTVFCWPCPPIRGKLDFCCCYLKFTYHITLVTLGRLTGVSLNKNGGLREAVENKDSSELRLTESRGDIIGGLLKHKLRLTVTSPVESWSYLLPEN